MKLPALFFILLLIASPAMAEIGTVTIYGTNASNAQQNVTISGAPASISVTAWNVGGVKTFKVNIQNASDTLTFNLYNVTVGQVNEFKVNGTAINGYQADSSGLVTFTRTQGTGNSTFNLAPAVQQGGFNTTWAQFRTRPSVQGVELITNVSAGDNISITWSNGVAQISSTGGGSGYNATYDAKLSNVSAGTNITITWSGCPSACVAEISSSGGGSNYNTTYDATTFTVNSNLVNWNATYNSSYNALLTNAPNTTLANYGNNFPNTSVTNIEGVNTAQNTSITALQTNDSYFNYTFLSQKLLEGANITISCYANGSCRIASTGGGVTMDEVNASAEIPRAHVTGQIQVDNTQNTTITASQTYANSSNRIAGKFGIMMSNGTSVIPLGIVNDGDEMAYNGTIKEIRAFARTSGSIGVSLWKDTYLNYPPTSDDIITSITITGSTKSESTGLNIPFYKGDIIIYNVDNATTINSTTISVITERTP